MLKTGINLNRIYKPHLVKRTFQNSENKFTIYYSYISSYFLGIPLKKYLYIYKAGEKHPIEDHYYLSEHSLTYSHFFNTIEDAKHIGNELLRKYENKLQSETIISTHHIMDYED